MSNRFKLLGGRKQAAPVQMQLGCGVSRLWPYRVVISIGQHAVEMDAADASQFASGIQAAAIHVLMQRMAGYTNPTPEMAAADNGDRPKSA